MRKGLPLEMKGNYCEITENDKTRFFEISVCDYNLYEINRWEKLGYLEETITWKYMKLIDEVIPDYTKYLYKLQTYLGLTGINDLWEFNENINDFQEYGFYDIKDLLNFCNQEWGITINDFKSIIETNIPH